MLSIDGICVHQETETRRGWYVGERDEGIVGVNQRSRYNLSKTFLLSRTFFFFSHSAHKRTRWESS